MKRVILFIMIMVSLSYALPNKCKAVENRMYNIAKLALSKLSLRKDYYEGYCNNNSITIQIGSDNRTCLYKQNIFYYKESNEMILDAEKALTKIQMKYPKCNKIKNFTSNARSNISAVYLLENTISNSKSLNNYFMSKENLILKTKTFIYSEYDDKSWVDNVIKLLELVEQGNY